MLWSVQSFDIKHGCNNTVLIEAVDEVEALARVKAHHGSMFGSDAPIMIRLAGLFERDPSGYFVMVIHPSLLK